MSPLRLLSVVVFALLLSCCGHSRQVTLADRRSYALAVFVSDYCGTLEGAERLIASVSAEVYDYFTAR